MASSARVCCGVGGGGVCVVRSDLRTVISRSSCVVSVANRGNRSEIGKISMTMSDSAPFSPAAKLERKSIGERKRGGSVISREQLDEWLRDYVVEIVKNLRESPLLVNLYAEDTGGLTTAATNPETDDWPAIKRKWDNGKLPEGVILVKKLVDCGEDDNYGGACGEGTSAWGIVAQGRGMDCGSVCYLLKTTRVESGMGSVCTYFYLVKVTSFTETAISQLNNSWLTQTRQ